MDRKSRQHPEQWDAYASTHSSSGSTTYSAKAPARFTPTPCVCAHKWRRPARQLRQRPQTTCPSPLTKSPGLKIRNVGTHFNHFAAELVPNHERHVDRVLRPLIPVINVQSVPQIPVASTRIFTSLIPGDGSGTFSSHKPFAAWLFTKAFILNVLCTIAGERIDERLTKIKITSKRRIPSLMLIVSVGMRTLSRDVRCFRNQGLWSRLQQDTARKNKQI